MGEIIVNAPSGQFTGTTVADDVTVFKRIVYGIAPRFSVARPPQHEDLHMHKCGEDGKEMCELVLSITAPASAKPLDDLPESLGFLRINEGSFLDHVHMRPYSDAREGTRGYIVAPPLYSHG